MDTYNYINGYTIHGYIPMDTYNDNNGYVEYVDIVTREIVVVNLGC